MSNPRYSIIVPVFNRPQEIEELLESLVHQHYKGFEVLIIEDGSTLRCDDVVDRYRDRLTIHYFYKPNSGPGPTRNFGFAHAHGEYFVVFDSDCIVPPAYFNAVEEAISTERLDAWGGPDRPHENFTVVQRATGYTMSSFLTTGGIRGGKKHVGWFQPRSFNMGISRRVFEETDGFQFSHLAEDIEFSIRMKKAGYKVGLIPEAFVFHKRRGSLREFYRQVRNFGRGRIMVGRVHPEEVKVAHWFPTFFIAGIYLTLLVSPFFPSVSLLAAAGYFIYFLVIFFHSMKVNRNLGVAILSIPAALLQLWGYGSGFFKEWLKSYTT
ncbi:MAG TPA: glycosyltransferase [Cyclobacteriaceae bacterium]|nr:glycosyltransferase [Cyclobacteriaceae bacterium]